jgi:hypothetical protein
MLIWIRYKHSRIGGCAIGAAVESVSNTTEPVVAVGRWWAQMYGESGWMHMAWVVIIFLDLHSEHHKSYLNLLDLQIKTTSINLFFAVQRRSMESQTWRALEKMFYLYRILVCWKNQHDWAVWVRDYSGMKVQTGWLKRTAMKTGEN